MVVNNYIILSTKEDKYYLENELELLEKDKESFNMDFVRSVDFQIGEERLRHGCRLVVLAYDKRKKLFSCRLNNFNVFMSKEEVFKYFS